jgi:hypothetical protein
MPMPAVQMKRVETSLFLDGQPLDYILGLRNGMNDSAVYPPERTPRPESKLAFDQVLMRHGAPVPRTVARAVDGRAELIDSGADQALGEFLRQLPPGPYFCKPDVGKNGDGAHRLDVTESGLRINGRQASHTELAQLLSAQPYLVQESLVSLQHPLQARYNPQVINTIRLMVFETDAGPAVIGGLMRMANESVAVDNFMQGGVCVPIDLERGVLRTVGFLKKGFQQTRVHTGSGLTLAGQPVPLLAEASALVCRMHGFIAMKTLGWDVALLKNGLCIIEANRTWDVLLSAYVIPGFLPAFLNYHLAEPIETTARFEFDGNFSDRGAARQWLCFLVGLSRVNARLDHFSPTRVILSISGSQRGMDAVTQRLKREAASFQVEKVKALKCDARLRRGCDTAASFATAPQPQTAVHA